MKITLFLENKIMEFFLPNQVSGSYNFDESPIEDYKLINIEAEDNKWVLHSKDYVKVYSENQLRDFVYLESNKFYVLQKEELSYLIYTSSSYDASLSVYTFNLNMNLIIGNTNDCNVFYNCPYLNGIACQIQNNSGTLKANINPDIFTYKNNERIYDNEFYIMSGDSLNILGLKIIFLDSLFIINNPLTGLTINESAANISVFNYVPEKYKNEEIKEIDLYDKKNFFSKSPRIRRLIEEKELKIDKPPKPKEAEEMPLLLTIGPMLTMGAMSCMNLFNVFNQISLGNTTWSKSWVQVASSLLMLTSSLLWPTITKAYNKHTQRDNRRKIVAIYKSYLLEKEDTLKKEVILQKNILEENLITTTDCLKIINTRKNNFWCKRVDQSDFLGVRVGLGKIPLQLKINWPEDGFSIEEDNLKKLADELIESYKYIDNCPLEYSFYDNFLTAVMGVETKCFNFVNNMLLQLMTFYCYDELKIVIFTSEENKQKWNYLKYSNYCFTNDKRVRFFASTIDESKELGNYLIQELNYKTQLAAEQNGTLSNQKPHYLIICDNYSAYKKNDFFKVLTELDSQIGYSTIIIENKLDRLPSKCINFINLNEGQSGILKNSYENAEITEFHDEIDYNINMMEVTKILSNIPIEIEGATMRLPDSIEFLEMQKVGKVEQLNILNRWNTNDSTKSLRAEVGVDETENYIYLDLHEKFHGPHGLVAGTTGSGKSEFLITYILSMAINYSPDDVAFILIDYKGGGLAYAFENKATGIKLPHLAGTITNLDKAEMNRTLVSIDSEVKRRQAAFNKSRDLLGESTIDIYKYQSLYHEGKIKEPIPHLFIISDEFAELKSQQPDFMDNLISVARIGRSLGVHLILATQKPSGVVNDQIWSNTKFRVCLKVADASDSNEMLKKPDAALLKQSGRFYLQVGMDEIYELGQSGWAGAKYYPSDKITKQVDKSINFIDNNGQIIKTIQESSNQIKKEAQGEQISAVMNEIINVAKLADKSAKRLWLDNIPSTILIDNINQKYNIQHIPFHITATIGEYDAPELQEQGPVIYNFLDNGNTAIYGTDGQEREQIINAIIYSSCKYHTTQELNMYALDLGSESLRIFENLPHFGGIVYTGENEKYTNLLKLLDKERTNRKKLFVAYGGDYQNYIKNSNQKLPLILVIINNIDAAKENIPDFIDDLTNLLRDSERYGIIYVITGNGESSIPNKIKQNINNNYALKLKDKYEYTDVLGDKATMTPSETMGRGMVNNNGIHEFQTASIVLELAELSKFMLAFIEQIKSINPTKAKKIPTLPEHVRLEDVLDSIKDLNNIPIGIIRKSLETLTINLKENIGYMIASNKIQNTTNFIKSLIEVLKGAKTNIILLDGMKSLIEEKDRVSNYFDDNFDTIIKKLTDFINDRIEKKTTNNVAIILYGIDKIKSKITDNKAFEDFINLIKNYEQVPIILVDDALKIKQYQFDNWYKNIFTSTEGIWIGTGVSDQTLFKISGYNKEYTLPYPNNMGFHVVDGVATLFKTIDFVSKENNVEGDQNE